MALSNWKLTAAAKATGGAISYYGGKTIHTFTGSGTFTNTTGSPLSVEYFAIAGGGAGGNNSPGGTITGGGGGAGGVVTSHQKVDNLLLESPYAYNYCHSVNLVDLTDAGGGTTITGPGPWSVTAYGGGGGGGNSAAAP